MMGPGRFLAAILAPTVLLPALSAVTEMRTSPDTLMLAGKWFVFRACGVRLVVAGLRRLGNPGPTATAFFGVTDPAAHAMVREIGFGNLSIGVLGLLALLGDGWIRPPPSRAGPITRRRASGTPPRADGEPCGRSR